MASEKENYEIIHPLFCQWMIFSIEFPSWCIQQKNCYSDEGRPCPENNKVYCPADLFGIIIPLELIVAPYCMFVIRIFVLTVAFSFFQAISYRRMTEREKYSQHSDPFHSSCVTEKSSSNQYKSYNNRFQLICLESECLSDSSECMDQQSARLFHGLW